MQQPNALSRELSERRPLGISSEREPKGDLPDHFSLARTGACAAEGPIVEPILQIHRGLDGFVTFHRKRGKEWENLASVQISDLQNLHSTLAPELERNAYFSINSFYRAGWQVGPLGLPGARRKGDEARYLNACYVDFDDHRDQPFNIGYWLGVVVSAQEQGVIPPASMISRSGRGLWLLWLLHGEKDPGLPPRAFPKEMRLFDLIESELYARLRRIIPPDQHARVDEGCKDIARVMRIPGSINSKAFPGDPARVQFWQQFGSTGSIYSYTLRELASLLAVAAPEARSNCSSRVDDRNNAMRGWIALWEHRLQDFRRLRAIRGSFREGCRNRSAYIYAIILRGAGWRDDQVASEIARFGNQCTPKLTPKEIQGAVRESKKSRRQLSDRLIAAYLRVTDEEAAQIPRWARQLPGCNFACADLGLTNRARIELRRCAMSDIVKSSGGRIPSSRQMARLLAQRGIYISHVQVNRDYKVFGIKA